MGRLKTKYIYIYIYIYTTHVSSIALSTVLSPYLPSSVLQLKVVSKIISVRLSMKNNIKKQYINLYHSYSCHVTKSLYVYYIN